MIAQKQAPPSAENVERRGITAWANYNSPKAFHTTLAVFMQTVRTGCTSKRNWIPTIEAIRSAPNPKKEKAKHKPQLPLYALGGMLSDRTRESLEVPSRIFALDFDAPENPNIEDWKAFRDSLAESPYVFFAALSISGKGVFGLIELATDHRERHLDQLRIDFESRGVIIDPDIQAGEQACRFISYDPEARYRPGHRVYDRLAPPTPIKPPTRAPLHEGIGFKNTTTTTTTKNPPPVSPSNKEFDSFEYCICELENRNIDITGGVNQWIALATAIAGEYGRGGFEAFHRISRISSPKYKGDKDCRAMYERQCRLKYSSPGIGYFYRLCAEHDISYQQGFEEHKKALRLMHLEKLREAEAAPPYPPAWDSVPVPDPSDPEYREMLAAEVEAGAELSPSDWSLLDPKVGQIISTFDAAQKIP